MLNSEQHINTKAIYKIQQHKSKNMAIWPPTVANKLFNWAVVHQVATCRFHACVYRRSLVNALSWCFTPPWAIHEVAITQGSSHCACLHVSDQSWSSHDLDLWPHFAQKLHDH